jgi:hypothetical protein
MRATACLIALVTLGAAPAWASCRDVVSACFCPSTAEVGIGVTESLDGGTASVRIDSATLGLDAGVMVSRPIEANETVGARWLVFSLERSRIDDSGKVTCDLLPEKPLLAVDVARAAGTQQCVEDLAALGVTQPPCYDNGPRCSVSSALSSTALLAWILGGTSRRRRRE